ncbi:MAG: hypothetical protein ACRCTZ_07915 [Sarcina sp.]
MGVMTFFKIDADIKEDLFLNLMYAKKELKDIPYPKDEELSEKVFKKFFPNSTFTSRMGSIILGSDITIKTEYIYGEKFVKLKNKCHLLVDFNRFGIKNYDYDIEEFIKMINDNVINNHLPYGTYRHEMQKNEFYIVNGQLVDKRMTYKNKLETSIPISAEMAEFIAHYIQCESRIFFDYDVNKSPRILTIFDEDDSYYDIRECMNINYKREEGTHHLNISLTYSDAEAADIYKMLEFIREGNLDDVRKKKVRGRM